MDIDHLLSKRTRTIDTSGIRRVFEYGAKLTNPINLSIGQPDFPVPDEVKRAAVEAIETDKNGYTLSQGVPALRQRIGAHLHTDLGWPDDMGKPESDVGVMVTSGTSGALLISMLTLLDENAEIVIPDPYFVAYPGMAHLVGGRAVLCDTYPDFRMTAARIEPLLTDKTRAVLLNSPGNPTGVVLSERECREVAELCRSRGVLLISDEIYDEFCYADALEATPTGHACPSPARVPGSHEDILLIRGFGKSYGCTGWRMGYAAGPKRLLDEMTKMQQYSFVCAPSIAQWGCLATFDADISGNIREYEARRDMVCDRLSAVTEVFRPGGARFTSSSASPITST